MNMSWIQIILSYLIEYKEMDPYDHHMAAYVILCVKQKVVQQMIHCKNKFRCNQCINLLLHDPIEKIDDELLALKDKNLQPCLSTENIIIFCNAVMKQNSNQFSQGNKFDSIWKTIINEMNTDDFYVNEDFIQHQHQLTQIYGHKDSTHQNANSLFNSSKCT